MIKKNDKDEIIAFLREKLRVIAEYNVNPDNYLDFKNFLFSTCPECGETLPIFDSMNANAQYIDANCFEYLRDIADMALRETTF